MCFEARKIETLAFKKKLTKAGKKAQVYKIVRAYDLSSPMYNSGGCVIHYTPHDREVFAVGFCRSALTDRPDAPYLIGPVIMGAGIYAYTSLKAARLGLISSYIRPECFTIITLKVNPADLLGANMDEGKCCFSKARVGKHVNRKRKERQNV